MFTHLKQLRWSSWLFEIPAEVFFLCSQVRTSRILKYLRVVRVTLPADVKNINSQSASCMSTSSDTLMGVV